MTTAVFVNKIYSEEKILSVNGTTSMGLRDIILHTSRNRVLRANHSLLKKTTAVVCGID